MRRFFGLDYLVSLRRTCCSWPTTVVRCKNLGYRILQLDWCSDRFHYMVVEST